MKKIFGGKHRLMAVIIFLTSFLPPGLSQAYVMAIVEENYQCDASAQSTYRQYDNQSHLVVILEQNDYHSEKYGASASTSAAQASTSLFWMLTPVNYPNPYSEIDVWGSGYAASFDEFLTSSASSNVFAEMKFIIAKRAGDTADMVNLPFWIYLTVQGDSAPIGSLGVTLNGQWHSPSNNAIEIPFQVGELNTLAFIFSAYALDSFHGQNYAVSGSIGFGLPAYMAPLPGTLLLLGSGLAGLVGWRRLKKS
jgi:hypothetical protein